MAVGTKPKLEDLDLSDLLTLGEREEGSLDDEAFFRGVTYKSSEHALLESSLDGVDTLGDLPRTEWDCTGDFLSGDFEVRWVLSEGE